MLLQTLMEQVRATSWQEWLSTASQLASVRLAQRNSFLTYPVGLMGVAVSSYLCLLSGLYADAGLNAYYALMSLYGWHVWNRKDESTGTDLISVGRCNAKQLWTGIGLGTLAFAVLYLVLRYLVGGELPLLDSFVSVTAVVGMWWAANRRIENWTAYSISNLVAVPLFYSPVLLYVLDLPFHGY